MQSNQPWHFGPRTAQLESFPEFAGSITKQRRDFSRPAPANYASTDKARESLSVEPCESLGNADPLVARRVASIGKLCECFSVLQVSNVAFRWKGVASKMKMLT
jgi:hypothetical protein